MEVSPWCYKWIELGMGWKSLGGVRYRAPYGSNSNNNDNSNIDNRGDKSDDSGHSGLEAGLSSQYGGLCHHQLEDRRLGGQGDGAYWGRRGLQVELR